MASCFMNWVLSLIEPGFQNQFRGEVFDLGRVLPACRPKAGPGLAAGQSFVCHVHRQAEASVQLAREAFGALGIVGLAVQSFRTDDPPPAPRMPLGQQIRDALPIRAVDHAQRREWGGGTRQEPARRPHRSYVCRSRNRASRPSGVSGLAAQQVDIYPQQSGGAASPAPFGGQFEQDGLVGRATQPCVSCISRSSWPAAPAGVTECNQCGRAASTRHRLENVT